MIFLCKIGKENVESRVYAKSHRMLVIAHLSETNTQIGSRNCLLHKRQRDHKNYPIYIDMEIAAVNLVFHFSDLLTKCFLLINFVFHKNVTELSAYDTD